MKDKINYIWRNLEFILAAIFFVAMVIALFSQVMFRFLFDNPIGWTEELAVTCFVMMVYIGSIGATRKDEHLKLELFINMFKWKGRIIMRIIGDIIFIIIGAILAFGIFTVSLNLKKYGMTTAMLGIAKWIPYMVLPVCFVAMDVRLVQNIIKKLNIIKSMEHPEVAELQSKITGEREDN